MGGAIRKRWNRLWFLAAPLILLSLAAGRVPRRHGTAGNRNHQRRRQGSDRRRDPKCAGRADQCRHLSREDNQHQQRRSLCLPERRPRRLYHAGIGNGFCYGDTTRRQPWK